MKIKQIAKKLIRDTKAEIYYSGACARDIVRRKKPNEYRFLVRNLALISIYKYLTRHFNEVRISKKQGVVIVTDNGIKGFFELPRDSSGKISPHISLQEDVQTRVFTIHGLYIPITSSYNILDLTDAKTAIKQKTVSTINDPVPTIIKDAVVMIEAVGLAAELNYKLDKLLLHAIISNSKTLDINNDTVNRIREAFNRIVLSRKSSKYFVMLVKSGLIYSILPELAMCLGVKQNPKYHKYDVFTHCILACEYAVPDLKIKLAALLHDIGKAYTQAEMVKNGELRITFYNHEVKGKLIARKFMRKLRYDPKLIKEVCDLVYNHMYNYDPKKWKDSAIRRFIKKTNIKEKDLKNLENFPLFLLRRADRLANGGNLTEVSHRQELFEERIIEVYKKSKALSVKDLDINGEDIIKHFNLQPGPTIGHILNYLLSLVIEDQNINKKDYLLNEAKNYLSNVLR